MVWQFYRGRHEGIPVVEVRCCSRGEGYYKRKSTKQFTLFTNMEESRSSTPEAPPQDLWSSILDSVSQSRSIPSKQILLLGQPSSGKSTLASALLQKPLSDNVPDAGRSDFAMGYDWADVRDEGDEGNSIRAYSRPLEAYSLEYRYLSTIVRIHRAVSCICIYLSAPRLSTTTLLFTSHSRCHCPRLDETVDICRGASDLAGMG